MRPEHYKKLLAIHFMTEVDRRELPPEVKQATQEYLQHFVSEQDKMLSGFSNPRLKKIWQGSPRKPSTGE